MNIFDFIINEFNEDSVIFEIGCHMGLDTAKIKELIGTKDYHCFECDPRNIDIIKSQNLDVILNEYAASNIDGEIEFYLSTGKPPVIFDELILNQNDWTASSSTKKPKKHLEVTPWCGFMEPILVKSKRIDTYCSSIELDNIDFVWMDVQGAELEVLSGFGDMLQKTKYIYTEYSDDELYEGGAVSKQNILDTLGKNWTIIYDFGNDVLLKNNN